MVEGCLCRQREMQAQPIKITEEIQRADTIGKFLTGTGRLGSPPQTGVFISVTLLFELP